MKLKILILFFIIFLMCVTNISAGKKILLARYNIRWMAFFIGINILNILISVLNQNPGMLTSVNVDVIEPLILLFVLANTDEDMYLHLKSSIVWISTFAYAYVIVYFCSYNRVFLPGVISEIMPFVNANYGGVVFSKAVPVYGLGVTWFYFLLPMCMAALFIQEDNKKNRLLKWNVLLGIINIIITMRTIFIIIFIVSCCMIFAMALKKNRFRWKRKQAVIVFGVLGTLVLMFLFANSLEITSIIINKMKVSFDAKAAYVNQYHVRDAGASVRLEQIRDLVRTWLKKPLLGWGASANSLGIVRSSTYGLYEMNYFAKLMQRGVIGFFLYAVLILNLFRTGRLLKHENSFYSDDLKCVLTGLAGMLLANATNPYLDTFDRLVILFLPLLFVNLESVRKRDRSS